MSGAREGRENPYPGLRPFQDDEAHLFFGRDRQRTELLGRLRRSRFLAVVGTSGCGKSSLVRAGLLPGLYGGFMAGGSSRWRVVDTRPGADPIGNLAQALDAEGALDDDPAPDPEWSFTGATLRRSHDGLAKVVKEARLPKEERVLVLVDQFEELFRFLDGERSADAVNDASAFVKLLLHASRQEEVPVYVVLTMRSDFLGDCARFRGLPEAINDSQYLIPRLTRDERREAIVGPAAVHDATLSPALVNRLLNDVGDNPDQLPIMQHALMRTWDEWKAHDEDGSELGLAHYEAEAVGGMEHALSRHAQSVLDALGDGDEDGEASRKRRIAERLFKCLSDESDHGQRVRRMASVQEVADVAGVDPDEVVAVAKEFRKPENAFLIASPKGVLRARTSLDISHESLIRNWTTLREWVQQEARSATTYKRLADTAARYPKEEDLLRGRRLRVPLEWREQQQPNVAWAARYKRPFERTMAFLAESEAARTRSARIRRALIATVAVPLLAGVMLLIHSIAEGYVAAEHQRVAHENASKALVAIYDSWSEIDNLIETDKDAAVSNLQAKVHQTLVHRDLPFFMDAEHHVNLGLDIVFVLGQGMRPKDNTLHRILKGSSGDLGKQHERTPSRSNDDDTRSVEQPGPDQLPVGTPHRSIAEAHVKYAQQRGRGALMRMAQQMHQFLAELTGGNIDKAWSAATSPAAGFALLVLCIPAWRWFRLRGALKDATAKKVTVIWRAGAAITDLLLAVVLGGFAGILVGTPLAIVLGLYRGDMGDVVEARLAGVAAGALVALGYLLLRDALKFQVHRSLGKILFGLRPVTVSGAPMSAKISTKHNAFWVALLSASIILGVFAASGALGVRMDDSEFATVVAGPLTSAMLMWLIMATFGPRRTLDDFISGSRVVDSRAAIANAPLAPVATPQAASPRAGGAG